MRIRFSKMHGLGNDFVLVDGISGPVQLSAEAVGRLGDRRLGVGFDQLLMATPDSRSPSGIGVRIFNGDGSSAEQCGNGMRCFARFANARGLIGAGPIEVMSPGGPVSLELLAGSEVRVGMGTPEFEPARIPFQAPRRLTRYEAEIDGHALSFGAVSMGNPHAVVDVQSAVSAPVAVLGSAVQERGGYPNGVNVGFREIVGPGHIRLRVYERGVGETLACGSGACAAVVTGIVQGVLANDVRVDLPGGSLRIAWAGPDQQVWMTGPTELVFEGEIEVEQ